MKAKDLTVTVHCPACDQELTIPCTLEPRRIYVVGKFYVYVVPDMTVVRQHRCGPRGPNGGQPLPIKEDAA